MINEIANLTDKEQIELLKKWWRNYGQSISVAIVLGLLIGFGWRSWHHHQFNQTLDASMLYDRLQVAYVQRQTELAQQLITQLMQQHAKTAYASLAGLYAARYAVEQKNYTQALQQLQWVEKQSPVLSFRQIAKLRAERIIQLQK